MSESYTEKIPVGCGTFYFTVEVKRNSAEWKARLEETQPMKVNGTVGKGGCCQRAFLEALCKTINIALKLAPGKVKKEKVLKDLISAYRGIRCENAKLGDGAKSCPDAIRIVFEKHIPKPEVKAEAGEK